MIHIIIIMLVSIGILLGFVIDVTVATPDTKQPTVQCTDGKLYDVSYEGNITIYDKRPFTECEETK